MAGPSTPPDGSWDLPDPRVAPRPWLVSWPPGVPTTWGYPAVGVHRLLADAARDVPDTIAVRDGAREVSWSRLATLVDDVARGLVRHRPDRVVLGCRGGLDALVVGLATWRIGALLEVVDPTLGRAARARARAPDEGVSDERAEVPDEPVPDPPDGGDAEVVVLVVDGLERVERSRAAAVVVADVTRILDRRTGRGRLRRFLVDRGPRLPGRTRLSTLVARAGQASLRPVDPDRDALVVHTPSGPVVASQRQLVASAFQVRLWIPDMATGSEVVAAARAWWQPGGWVLGPLLAALTGATCQVADADLPGDTIPGATIAFAGPQAWRDLVGARRWRSPIGRRRGGDRPLATLRVAGVVLDPGATPIDRPLVERILVATEGARVRHAWQPTGAVGPVLAQPVYGRFHGDPGALPLPDTVLAGHAGRAWAHGPQFATEDPHGWVLLDDPALPLGALAIAADGSPAQVGRPGDDPPGDQDRPGDDRAGPQSDGRAGPQADDRAGPRVDGKNGPQTDPRSPGA